MPNLQWIFRFFCAGFLPKSECFLLCFEGFWLVNINPGHQPVKLPPGKIPWSYVKKKYKLNVTNFLCSERSLTCYFYCILLTVFKILFLIFIWRQISTMTVNAYGIIKCFDVFKNQFMCMCIIKDFKPVDPFSLQKCMERFYTGVIPWICFL